MTPRTFLISQLDELIETFGADSKGHKTQYRILRYTVFTLTAFSTLLAGAALLAPHMGPGMSLAILVLSAVSGVVTSVEGVRKPAELWVHERATYLALKDLKREVEFSTDDTTCSACLALRLRNGTKRLPARQQRSRLSALNRFPRQVRLLVLPHTDSSRTTRTIP
jgi:hypothetical protein